MEDCVVLLVDDESDFREVVAKRLRKRNVKLVSVDSGHQALKVLQETPIDVVVLDVKMAGMDGMETLGRIKELDPTLEVILLTGHANTAIALQGMELGAFDYLMKPVTIESLMARLQDAYRKRCLAREQRR